MKSNKTSASSSTHFLSFSMRWSSIAPIWSLTCRRKRRSCGLARKTKGLEPVCSLWQSRLIWWHHRWVCARKLRKKQQSGMQQQRSQVSLGLGRVRFPQRWHWTNLSLIWSRLSMSQKRKKIRNLHHRQSLKTCQSVRNCKPRQFSGNLTLGKDCFLNPSQTSGLTQSIGQHKRKIRMFSWLEMVFSRPKISSFISHWLLTLRSETRNCQQSDQLKISLMSTTPKPRYHRTL